MSRLKKEKKILKPTSKKFYSPDLGILFRLDNDSLFEILQILTNNVYQLNSAGTYVFDLLLSGKSSDEVLQQVEAKFGDRSKFAKSVIPFIEKLEKLKIIFHSSKSIRTTKGRKSPPHKNLSSRLPASIKKVKLNQTLVAADCGN